MEGTGEGTSTRVAVGAVSYPARGCLPGPPPAECRRQNLVTACRALQRREGAQVSDAALMKFCSLWNGDWTGPLVHYCDGCCSEGEVPNNMFAAAIEVDLLQSRPQGAGGSQSGALGP